MASVLRSNSQESSCASKQVSPCAPLLPVAQRLLLGSRSQVAGEQLVTIIALQNDPPALAGITKLGSAAASVAIICQARFSLREILGSAVASR